MVESPADEILKFMEMALKKEEEEVEKEKTKYYMQYLITMFAQAPQGEEKAEQKNMRRQFLDTIRPREKEQQRKQFDWPDEVKKLTERGE